MTKVSVRKLDLMRLDGRDVEGLNRVLREAGHSTIFHTLEWNRLLIEHFHLPHAALAASVDGNVVGWYIFHPHEKGALRSPAVHLHSVYGGPLVVGDEADVVHSLLQEAERLHPFSHFQVWTSPGAGQAPFLRLGYEGREMYTPILRLGGSAEERWDRLHKDKRYKIRRAQKEGVRVEVGRVDELPIYYQMASNTLARGGLAPLPFDFLRLILERLGVQDMARLFLARLGGQVISGAVILYHKDTAYGWDIGWRREFASISPNDILTWEIAERASAEGFRFLDLLRIEPDRLPGIAKWKETFGGEIVPCHQFWKATRGYNLIRPLRVLLTEPGRAVRKLRSRFT